MFYTSDDFIENEMQDQRRLTLTGLRVGLNARQTSSARERLAYTTSKLLSQQQRLYAQQQALLHLQQRLERQYDMLFGPSQPRF